MAGRGGVGPDGPAGRVEGAVEEHRLDPDVVVEPFQVPQVRGGGSDMGVQVRAAVPGNVQAVGGRDCRDPHPFGDAAAAGDVGLQAVDRAGRAHPAEVVQVVAVFAGGYVGCDCVADLAEPVEVVGGDGFLEPPHVQVSGGAGDADRLLAVVAAVGVDEQL